MCVTRIKKSFFFNFRNPWAGGVDSDHGTSSSASIPPPRPATRQVRSRSNSIASSSRAPSRSLGTPGKIFKLFVKFFSLYPAKPLIFQYRLVHEYSNIIKVIKKYCICKML
jgi:hypothetical protein